MHITHFFKIASQSLHVQDIASSGGVLQNTTLSRNYAGGKRIATSRIEYES
jgi:hypothetical protein